VRRRVRDPGRRLHDGLGLRGRRRRRDRLRGDVHAAADLRRAAPQSRPRCLRRGARPPPGGARDHRPARAVPARALGLAGRDHRALVPDRAVARRAGGLAVIASITTPPIDWFALATPLSLLAAGGINLLVAVLVPRGDRRVVASIIAAVGYATAIAFAVALYQQSPDGHGVIAAVIQRHR